MKSRTYGSTPIPTIIGDMIYVSGLLYQDARDIKIPGKRWKPKEQKWVFPLEGLPALCRFFFPGVDIKNEWKNIAPAWHYAYASWQEMLTRKLEVARQTARILEGQHSLVSELRERYPFLMEHQAVGAALCLLRKRIAIYHQTGTGKTTLLLTVISEILREDPEAHILVLCPRPIITPAWLADARDWFPDLPIENLHPVAGKKRDVSPGIVGIINYESFWRSPKLVHDAAYTAVICDESVKIKADDSTIGRAMRGGKKEKRTFPGVDAEYKIIASGYPDPNGPEDFWGQLAWIQEDEEIFPASFWHFRQRYMQATDERWIRRYGKPKKIRTGWKLLPSREQLFYDQIAKIAFFKERDDCIDIPAAQDIIYEIPLPPSIRKLYDSVEVGIYGMITSPAGTNIHLKAQKKAWYLQEICCGFVKDGPDQVWLSNHKLDMLKELLEQLGSERTLIWTTFHAEYDEVVKSLLEWNIPFAAADGRSNAKQQDGAVEKFNAGEVRVLVSNVACFKYGLTFVRDNRNAIYMSLSFNFDDHGQSRDRISRKGQQRKQNFYYLIAEDTVDQAILGVLRRKGNVVKAAFDEIRRRHSSEKSS